MKKVIPLLIVSILLLTSCSLGDLDVIKDLFKEKDYFTRKDFFATNDSAIANERFEELIEAIQNQDSDALKSLFSDNALKEAQNLDETINELFDYYQGEMLSYNDWGGSGVLGRMNEDGTGRYWKKMYSTYDVETSQDKYRFAMEFISMDNADADNEGIRSLYVIRLEDDTDPEYAYRGDDKYTPGININIKNVIQEVQDWNSPSQP